MSQSTEHLISRHWSSLKKEILESRRIDQISGYLSNHRFLLVIHKSGFEKIISTSKSLLSSGKIRSVVILSLTENFEKEMINYGINKNYIFYTYKNFPRSKIDISDSLLIIKEVHNLLRLENWKNVISSLKTAGKVLILSETPINSIRMHKVALALRAPAHSLKEVF